MAGKELSRGVIVDFDFAVLDGAEILYSTASKLLADLGETLTPKREALHLAGGNYQGGIAELFAESGNKNDAAAAARDLATAFRDALAAKVAAGVPDGFKAFLKALAGKDLKVVVVSRVDAETLKAALGDAAGDHVVPYVETSVAYGGGKWDAWKRAASNTGLVEVLTVAVAGSGHGVKASLVAGFATTAVIHPHVAYQDFGGADTVFKALDAKAADDVLRLLRIA